MGDRGDPEALPALCSAKAEVAVAAEHLATEAMTLVGGRGYAAGHVLHRLYRDARAAHVMAPTTDMLRTWTGRAMLGRPLLGD
jgi:alkylation response protein AidB-like acyl-CoA dehydrogenase